MPATPWARLVQDKLARVGWFSRASRMCSRYELRVEWLRSRILSVTERTRSCSGALVFMCVAGLLAMMRLGQGFYRLLPGHFSVPVPLRPPAETQCPQNVSPDVSPACPGKWAPVGLRAPAPDANLAAA